MTRTVAEALDDFLAHASQSTERLLAPYQPDLRSPCETGPPIDPEHELVTWQPVRQDNPDLLLPLERAFEVVVHPDVKTWWGRYFAGPLAAEATEGALTLLQLWAPDDAERLAENLIGHAFARQRLKAPLSWFFACTEEGPDLLLTVHNATGEVLLESPEKKPFTVVAPDLATFIDTLTPAAPTRMAPGSAPAPERPRRW